MKSIKYLRVDNRFIHGQVLIKWLVYLDIKEIIILDDVICDDPIIKSILKMSLPKEVNLYVYDIESGVNVYKSKDYEKEPLILIGDLYSLKKLNECGLNCKSVNITRIPYSTGKKKIYEGIYVSPEEIKIIEYFLNKNTEFIVQMVPDSEKVNLADLL